MDDSLNICLPCGMCCEGVMIGFVQLEKEEVPRLREIMEIDEEGGQGFFLQPCKKFCEKCTIYPQRPKQCDSFNCGLLQSVEAKELKFNAAIDIIDDVKRRKAIIEEKVEILKIELKAPSFHFKMVELKNLFRLIAKESILSNELLDLNEDVEELDKLMLKRFGVPL